MLYKNSYHTQLQIEFNPTPKKQNQSEIFKMQFIVLCSFAFLAATVSAASIQSEQPKGKKNLIIEIEVWNNIFPDISEEASHDIGGPFNGDEEIIVRQPKGFGCPFDQQKCHLHCISIGRKGGYCAGAIKQTCTCYAS